MLEGGSIGSEPEGDDKQAADAEPVKDRDTYCMVVEREVMPDGRSIIFYSTGSG